MSEPNPEPAVLIASSYTIRSYATYHAPVGVNPPSQDVRVDAKSHIWDLTPVGKSDGVYRLSLKDSYRFTGVGSDGSIIATINEADNKNWHIKHWPFINAFTIEPDYQIRPAKAWTLVADEKIVLGTYEVPNESQLFKLVKLS